MASGKLTGQTNSQLKALTTSYVTLHTGTAGKKHLVKVYARNGNDTTTRSVTVRAGGGGAAEPIDIPARSQKLIFQGVIEGADVLEALQDIGTDVAVNGIYLEM